MKQVDLSFSFVTFLLMIIQFRLDRQCYWMAVMMNKVWKQYIAEYCRIKFIAIVYCLLPSSRCSFC